jgi:hypothetical protein
LVVSYGLLLAVEDAPLENALEGRNKRFKSDIGRKRQLIASDRKEMKDSNFMADFGTFEL